MGAASTIRPQEGPQTTFLASAADIAIYGGVAGGGKTWALLMEPLRHSGNPDFGAVFFRRTTVQIRNEGGLWDESTKLYPLLGATPRENTLEWFFPSGASVSMAHLEHEKTVANWQGSQIALLLFDELTHFSEKQLFYMLSRNRSMSGVRPYVRATCKPDADSWVARFKALTEAGEFEGYASIFGEVDQGRDVVLSGAFRDSLIRRPAERIKMLWQHDREKIIGKARPRSWFRAGRRFDGHPCHILL